MKHWRKKELTRKLNRKRDGSRRRPFRNFQEAEPFLKASELCKKPMRYYFDYGVIPNVK